ncbi:methylamine utilization protein [Glaciecola sp. SC05]|uniref:methylamine utilization protein n=1 Tax=Glaciecola sp. SC05 TaxID=1987355 RepID=UPI0035292BB2
MNKLFWVITGVLLCSKLMASELSVQVLDNKHQPLSNIVVELVPSEKSDSDLSLPVSANMKQLDQKFVPHILAISKGTQVHFPDSDSVRHHVYSFSEAKTFEIAIYKEEVKRRIEFEQAGVVELGCNIHDWMLGYIYVAESPLFQQTAPGGLSRFSELPNGRYTIKVWHPRIALGDIQTLHEIDIESHTQNVVIRLKEDLRPSLDDFDSVHAFSEYD